MYRIFLTFVAMLSLAHPCLSVEVPTELAGNVFHIEDATDTWGRRLCERFDFCEKVKFDYSAAIIVGISDYPYLPKLKSTKDDALKMKDYLVKSGEFDDIIMLTEKNATKENIKFFMEDYLPEKFSSGRGRFLFYFSGHGDIRPGDDSRGYLRLYGDHPGLFSGSIGMDVIRVWATSNLKNAVHSLFIIDTCMSGLVAYETKTSHVYDPSRGPTELMANAASVVLTAGDGQQLARAGDQWGGSLFTDVLINGLTDGKADSSPQDGIITAAELYNYASGAVGNETDHQQTPQSREFKRVKNGDFFFLSPRFIFQEVVADPGKTGFEVKSTNGTINFGMIGEQLWNFASQNKNIALLDNLIKRFPDSEKSSAASVLRDKILTERTKAIEPEERWTYWKDRGLWENDAIYCVDLERFIKTTRNVKELKYYRTNKPVDVSAIKEGELASNFWIRAENNDSNHYCGVAKNGEFDSIYCSRNISSDVEVFKAVFYRTLADLRACLRGSGWQQYTAKDIDCGEQIAKGESCDHGFSRGGQDLWIYGVPSEGRYRLGLQVEIGNDSGLPVQGSYEFDENGRFIVSGNNSEKGNYRYVYDLTLDRVDELTRSAGTYAYFYNKDGSLSSIERKRKNEIVESWTIGLNPEGKLNIISSSLGWKVSIYYSGNSDDVSRIVDSRYGEVRIQRGAKGEVTDIKPVAGTTDPNKILDNLRAIVGIISKRN